MRLRATIAVVSALSVAALALAGCSTGGGSGSGGGSTGGSGGSGGGSSATATFTGDLTGSIVMNTCTDGGSDSVFFVIAGDSSKYPGSISADQLGFVGPDAKAWSLDKSGPAPVAITTGSGGFTLDGVKVHYTLPGSPTEEVTVSGKLLCP